jgi:hypothetical protein
MSATAQPRQERSIKSSSHSAQKPVSLRPLVPEARDAVTQLVEKLLGTNWRISHRINIARDKYALENTTLYAWRREGRERPGLLILENADKPAVYWDMDRDEPSSLRFQIPFGFLRNGPWIFSATLLRGERRLILDDAFVADGVHLQSSVPYSERWKRLVGAYKSFNSQQLFLGFALSIIKPISLEKMLAAPPEAGTIWEFQPENAGRLRLYWTCPGAKVGPSAGAQARAAEATAHLRLPPEVNKNVLKRNAAIPTIRVARVAIDCLTGLPDAYILQAADGSSLGRASISKLQQSIELRKALRTKGGPTSSPAEVVWNTNFKKYEIMRLLPEDTPIMGLSSFYELTEVSE